MNMDGANKKARKNDGGEGEREEEDVEMVNVGEEGDKEHQEMMTRELYFAKLSDGEVRIHATEEADRQEQGPFAEDTRDSDDEYSVTSQMDDSIRKRTESKGYETNDCLPRKERGREADRLIRKAREAKNSEIEVVIEESSDEEGDDGLCVRVIFKDGSMTEKMLYSMIGNQVPIKPRHHP
eukprot:Phypoly_transcript_10058.p1 GENE.Phypoly_transcript_10058~~Phypoly_transcript_10058.p1  ORF type:complete len:193 (-),score=33.26 Phypoly_transcript_10058:766-1308(-)